MSEFFYSASSASSFRCEETKMETEKQPSGWLNSWLSKDSPILAVMRSLPFYQRALGLSPIQACSLIEFAGCVFGLSSDRVFEYYDFPLSTKTNLWFDFIFHF